MSMGVAIDPTDMFAETKYNDFSDMTNGPKAMATLFYFKCRPGLETSCFDTDFYRRQGQCKRSGRTEEQCDQFFAKTLDELCDQTGRNNDYCDHRHMDFYTTRRPYVPPMIPATTGKPAAASFPILPTVGGFVVGAILTITAVMIIQLVCKKIKKSKNAKTSAVPQKGK